MGKFDNLNDSQLPELIRRIEKLERGTPMNNSAIGRGGVTVYDGGVINIENGGLIVNGTATIHGTLNADGTITFSGTVDISGPLTVSGDTDITGALTIAGTTDITGDTTVAGDLDVNGPMKTTGTLSVEGVSTLKNDLNVTSGGKIVAGAVTVDPSYLSGSVKFSNGTYVAATPNGAQMAVTGIAAVGLGVSTTQAFMNADGGYVTTTASGVNLAAYGGASMTVTTAGVTMAGLPTKSGVTANLYIDPANNKVYRVV